MSETHLQNLQALHDGLLELSQDRLSLPAGDFKQQVEQLDKLLKAEPAQELSTDPAELKQALISLVRKVIPSLIAADICGVQPMTDPVGKVYSVKLNLDENKWELPRLSFKYNVEHIEADHQPVTRTTLTPISYGPYHTRIPIN